jgi:hypothetical protein
MPGPNLRSTRRLVGETARENPPLSSPHSGNALQTVHLFLSVVVALPFLCLHVLLKRF